MQSSSIHHSSVAKGIRIAAKISQGNDAVVDSLGAVAKGIGVESSWS